jgi:hypothetical protein
MPTESNDDDIEMIALAEILNAANAGELPDPRAISILKKNGTIKRIRIIPPLDQAPLTGRTNRDLHIAATVENRAAKVTSAKGTRRKFSTHDEQVSVHMDANGRQTFLSGRQVSRIHQAQKTKHPHQLENIAWLHRVRVFMQHVTRGQKKS